MKTHDAGRSGYAGWVFGLTVILLAAGLTTVSVADQRPDPLVCHGRLGAGFPLPVVCDASGESPLSSVGKIDWADLDGMNLLGVGADVLFYGLVGWGAALGARRLGLVLALITIVSLSQPWPARAGGPAAPLYLPMVSRPGYYVVRDRAAWPSAVGEGWLTEDFEQDAAGYGLLSWPYQTGHGLILTGSSAAQILVDATLLPSGHLLHFRDWGSGLAVWFPNGMPVQTFGFDYRASETWQLTVNTEVIPLPPGQAGFVGLVFDRGYPTYFVLSSPAEAQGGLAVDNIAYLAASSR